MHMSLTAADGGMVGLDWLDLSENGSKEAEDERPVLLILHGPAAFIAFFTLSLVSPCFSDPSGIAHRKGLTGSSSAPYVKHLARAAHAAGMHVAALSNRGSAGAPPLQTARTFSAAFTDDLRHTAEYIKVCDTDCMHS